MDLATEAVTSPQTSAKTHDKAYWHVDPEQTAAATRGSPRICVGLDDSHGIGSPRSHPSPSRWNAFAPALHEMILTLRVVPSLLLPEDVRTQLQLKVFDMDDRWIIHSNDTQRTTFKAILMPMNMLSSLQITSMPSISNCKRKQIAGLSWSPLWQTSSNRALSSENAWTCEDHRRFLSSWPWISLISMIMLTILHCTLSTERADHVMTWSVATYLWSLNITESQQTYKTKLATTWRDNLADTFKEKASTVVVFMIGVHWYFQNSLWHRLGQLASA